VLNSITISADKVAPQRVGTPITFTAFASGTGATQEYKWTVDDGTGPKAMTSWRQNSQYVWTPSAANANYRVSVSSRDSGHTVDVGEASASTRYVVSAPPAIRAVTFGADKPAPQPLGSTIKYTATADGGDVIEYKWLIHDGVQWAPLSGWSSDNTFAWTPTAANAYSRIGVWARNKGITKDEGEQTFSMDYAINPPAPAPIRAVSFSANKPAPQPAGSSITFSATVDGGGVVEYKWLIHNGLVWAPATGWSTDRTFTWTPAAANAYTRIGLWVRNRGNAKDEGELTFSIDYAIGAAAPTVNAAPAAPITWASFVADRPAPQPVGASVTFTATIGGGGVVEYKWLIHDGLNWTAVSGWSTSNTFVWTPSAANPYARVGLWVRNAGNTIDAGEQTFSMDYSIAGAIASLTSNSTIAVTLR
jgi:cell wall-associated protease